jgi:hypothetical protein
LSITCAPVACASASTCRATRVSVTPPERITVAPVAVTRTCSPGKSDSMVRCSAAASALTSTV